MKCDACDKHVEEVEAVKGYLAPGSVFCVPCYEYLDNEVFTAKVDEDDCS